MSSEQDQIRSLAERIARRLSTSESKDGGKEASGDVASLRSGLDEVQRRLSHLESHIEHDDSCEATQRGGKLSLPTRKDAASQIRREGDEQGSTPARSLWLSGT